MNQGTNNVSGQDMPDDVRPNEESEYKEPSPEEELPEVEEEQLPEVEEEELPVVEEEELPEVEEEPLEEEAGPDEAGTDDEGKTEAKAEAEEPVRDDKDHKKKGKLFGKKDSKDEKIEELQDRLTRQMAEFDNYRKRTDKEKANMYDVGARDIIEKILPIVDNFERGISAIPEDEKGTPFAEGMVMIYKQLTKMLEDAGVEVIEAEGKPFDPQLHNAVMHIDDDSYGENVVSQELQKGYKYHGTVIRHSLVQVAN